jgi:hypothetical protein
VRYEIKCQSLLKYRIDYIKDYIKHCILILMIIIDDYEFFLQQWHEVATLLFCRNFDIELMTDIYLTINIFILNFNL